MKTEDRKLIFYYLNNLLKVPLQPKVKNQLWEWAVSFSTRVFRCDLERLGEETTKAVGASHPGCSSLDNLRQITEAKFRLLKQLVAAANPPAVSALTGHICERAEKIADCFHLKRAERDILRFYVAAIRLFPLAALCNTAIGRWPQNAMARTTIPLLVQLMGCSVAEIERAIYGESPLVNNELFRLDNDGDFFGIYALDL